MTEERRSIAFDRAAEYYDRTRGLSPEGSRRNTEVLETELRGRGKVLEVGVGTGQVALPLRAAGIDVMGVDLSWPMLEQLRAKPRGRKISLVEADATRLPFADGAFGAAYLRWVLHLIPRWRLALTETARVVRPSGVVLVLMGSFEGPKAEIRDRFAEVAGISVEPAGLTWSGTDLLDSAMAQVGATFRPLPGFTDIDLRSVRDFLDAIEANQHSWTWGMPVDVRLRTVSEVRRWAQVRFGSIEQIPLDEYGIVWRAYDLG